MTNSLIEELLVGIEWDIYITAIVKSGHDYGRKYVENSKF